MYGQGELKGQGFVEVGHELAGAFCGGSVATGNPFDVPESTAGEPFEIEPKNWATEARAELKASPAEESEPKCPCNRW